MTVTEPVDWLTANRSNTPALTTWLSLTTEHIDGAKPTLQPIEGQPYPTVKFDLGGLACQSFRTPPAEIADALRRLADRIDAADLPS